VRSLDQVEAWINMPDLTIVDIEYHPCAYQPCNCHTKTAPAVAALLAIRELT